MKTSRILALSTLLLLPVLSHAANGGIDLAQVNAQIATITSDVIKGDSQVESLNLIFDEKLTDLDAQKVGGRIDATLKSSIWAPNDKSSIGVDAAFAGGAMETPTKRDLDASLGTQISTQVMKAVNYLSDRLAKNPPSNPSPYDQELQKIFQQMSTTQSLTDLYPVLENLFDTLRRSPDRDLNQIFNNLTISRKMKNGQVSEISILFEGKISVWENSVYLKKLSAQMSDSSILANVDLTLIADADGFQSAIDQIRLYLQQISAGTKSALDDVRNMVSNYLKDAKDFLNGK